MNTRQSLEQINVAISAIEQGAQEYQIGSRRIKKADLGTLYAERRRLEQQIIEQENYGGITVACFDRR